MEPLSYMSSMVPASDGLSIGLRGTTKGKVAMKEVGTFVAVAGRGKARSINERQGRVGRQRQESNNSEKSRMRARRVKK